MGRTCDGMSVPCLSTQPASMGLVPPLSPQPRGSAQQGSARPGQGLSWSAVRLRVTSMPLSRPGSPCWGRTSGSMITSLVHRLQRGRKGRLSWLICAAAFHGWCPTGVVPAFSSSRRARVRGRTGTQMHLQPMMSSQLRPLSPHLQHQPGLGAPLVQQPQGQPRLQLQHHRGRLVPQPQQLLPRPQPRAQDQQPPLRLPPWRESRPPPSSPRAASRRLSKGVLELLRPRQMLPMQVSLLLLLQHTSVLARHPALQPLLPPCQLLLLLIPSPVSSLPALPAQLLQLPHPSLSSSFPGPPSPCPPPVRRGAASQL